MTTTTRRTASKRTAGTRRRTKEPTIVLTKVEVEEIASDAAERALLQFMLSLGVDTSTPNGILNAQRDFQHLRSWRQSVETIKRQGLISAIGVLTIGLLALIWAKIGNPTSPH